MDFFNLLNIIKHSAVEFYIWNDHITVFMPVLDEFVAPLWPLISKACYHFDAEFYALDWDDDYYHQYLGEWYSIPL